MPINMQNVRSAASIRNFCTKFLVAISLLCTLHSSNVLALDPPTNIRLEDGVLHWDAVAGASEYHIYYFDGPIPSSTVLGNFVVTTGGTRWSLAARSLPLGYYTVVSIQTYGQSAPVEYSKVTDGAIVPFLNTPQADDSSLALLNSGQLENYYAGDDGYNKAGVPTTSERYVLNGDGTFTDTLTQLVWLSDSSCIPLLDWVAAVDYANKLTTRGGNTCANLRDGSQLGDWRLANIVELMSLYNYGLSGAIGDIPISDVRAVIGDDFWSSTSFQSAPTPNDIGMAWEVKFLSDPDAGSHVDQKLNLGRAWAVRNR